MSALLCGCFRKKQVIEYWDCSHLHLSDLPREVLKYRPTLTTLYMGSNNIRELPSSIYTFESLSELDLSENDIIFLSPGISRLLNLTVLNLSKNSLSSIPSEIQDCQDLVTLNLSSNPLGSLCDGLMELRQLRNLLVNDCSLEDLPPNIGKLSKLEVLELRENLVRTLPASISHLTLLEKLDLGVNEFQTLPTVVGSLGSLSVLWLDNNTLHVLPEELGQLHNLHFLELSENQLMALPVTMDGLAGLTDLYLQDNLLSCLPDTAGKLPNLIVLNLENNRLGSLPETIDGWTSLKELNVSHNHLIELPAAIGSLTNLFNFNADENLLTMLPEEMGSCSSLSVLSLRNNQLLEIPAEFSELSKLTILNVIGNRLHHLPYTLTSLQNVTAIWIAENQSRPIMDLQLEKDPEGERCLTCYLLPQQGHESPYNAPGEDSISSDSGWEPSRPPPLHRKGGSVAFDPKVQDKKSKISRDPTPFPKELHAKAIQWRQNRRDSQNSHGEPEGGGSGIQLRSANGRKSFQRPYSLLKALSDPLDEDNLIPKRRSREVSPDILPIQEGEEQATPIDHTPQQSLELRGSITNEETTLLRKDPVRFVSPPPLLPPALSCPNSPSEVTSDPCIDPPVEFLGNSVLKFQHNGGVSYQLQHDREASVASLDNDQAALIANSNSNNNNNGNQPLDATDPDVSYLSGGDAIPGAALKLRLQPNAIYIPSEASTVSRSDAPSVRYSSMESGFDADVELETNSAWYIPADVSPRPNQEPTEEKWRVSSLGSQDPVYDRLPLVRDPSRQPQGTPSSSGSVPPAPQTRNSHSRHLRNSHSFDAADLLECASSLPSRIASPPHQPPRVLPAGGNTRPPASHARSQSQPEELIGVGPHLYGTGIARGYRNPLAPRVASHYSAPTQVQPDTSRRPHRQEDHPGGRGSPQHPFFHQRTEHVTSEETGLQRDEPRPQTHMGSHRYQTAHVGRSKYVRVDPAPQDQQRPPYSDGYHGTTYTSDESHSGRGTPPMTGKQSTWVSSHDSGFDSTRRESTKSTRSGSSLLSHPGSVFEVELVKDPTLGLGITGGVDGENGIKPGDPGYHVYKVMEGYPAHKSGKIAVGDKLLEVNGVDISSLSNQESLALLMGPEQHVSLLLYREPSVTLL